LAITVPLIWPLGLPLAVLPETRQTYDALDSIPNNTVVLFSFDYGAAAVAELDPQARAVLQHFLAKGMKIVAVSSVIEGPPIANGHLEATYGAAGREYGVDYVNLGFFAGGEAGLAALAENVRGVFQADHAGTPLDRLPIMTNVRNIKDFSLAFSLNISPTGSAVPATWVRQVYTAFDVPVGLGVVTVMAPSILPYLDAKQIIGLLTGLRSAAEYELLIGRPGSAVAAMDAQSMSHVLIILAIVLGNIGYYASLSQRRSPGGGPK
jgi:hypothetical protein